jgi:beta-glucuronidase
LLRPQESAVRERKSLAGLWEFALDPTAEGRTAGWFGGRLPAAREMPVPASFNDVLVDPTVHGHVGEVWYQTAAWVPAGWAERRIVLHFESVTHRATVWVNGTEVVTHSGGYTPFEAEVTGLVRPGEPARITVADAYRQPVGVRTVAVDGNRFLINGEPFYFTGFGKHEDVPVLGKGHSDAFLVHDFALLAWVGANSFRTSHYPYAEDWLDYADRHGVVVVDETPAVGLNIRAGAAGMYAGADLPTFSPDTVNEQTRAAHAQAIRELVARDRNHPSVVLWSIANEPESDTDAAARYFQPLFDLTRALDPTRPVGFVNDAGAPHGRCRVSRYADVLMLNRYYGWYTHTGDLAAAEIALDDELRAWATDGKPIIVTEYGADTYPGLHATMPIPWTEEYQVAYLEMNHRVFDRIDAITGEHPWNFADFATTSGVTRVGGNRKGAFTRDRHPKAAAHALRRRWHGRPRG